jgi:hypothetical protein
MWMDVSKETFWPPIDLYGSKNDQGLLQVREEGMED